MVLSPIIKKLMFVRQFDIDKGKITLLGGKEIMLDASAVLELQEIDQSKVYSAGKSAGFKNIKGAVEHAQVYSKMKDIFINEIARLGKRIGQSDNGTVKTLQEIFNVFGLGEMVIQDLDSGKKKAIIVIKNSTIAEEWTEKNKSKSKAGVCVLTSGILAGMFSYIFGKKVDCTEKSCKAEGKSYCLFEIA